MRARGGNPGILIAVTEPGILPLVSYANVDENMLAAVLLRVQIVAQDAISVRDGIDELEELRP